jgi:hypothetical protein
LLQVLITMKNRVLLTLAFVSLAGTLPACGGRMFFPAVIAADVGVTAAVLSTREPPRVVVIPEVAPPPSLRTDGTLPPPGFDPALARAIVEDVDIAACWVPGSTHGTGTVRLTFNPRGDVGLVEIVNPVEGATLDANCAAQRYNALRVLPFNGAPITVTGNIYVG